MSSRTPWTDIVMARQSRDNCRLRVKVLRLQLDNARRQLAVARGDLQYVRQYVSQDYFEDRQRHDNAELAYRAARAEMQVLNLKLNQARREYAAARSLVWRYEDEQRLLFAGDASTSTFDNG